MKLFHKLTFNMFRCWHREWVSVTRHQDWCLRCVRFNNHKGDHRLPEMFGFNGGGYGVDDKVEATRHA